MAKNRNASLDLAWEYYLQGFRLHWLVTPEANREARAMFVKAAKIRPDFARAYAHLSFTLLVAWLNGWDSPPGVKNTKVSPKNIMKYAEEAVDIGGEDYDNLWSLGLAQTYSGRLDEAVATYKKAIKNARAQDAAPINIAALKIDLADALMFSATDDDKGEKTVHEAIKLAREALSASQTPQRWFHWTLGWLLYEAGYYEGRKGNTEAEKEYSRQALEALSRFRRPDTLVSKLLIAVNMSLGSGSFASNMATEFLKANPDYTPEIEDRWPYLPNSERHARYKNHLLAAGLRR